MNNIMLMADIYADRFYHNRRHHDQSTEYDRAASRAALEAAVKQQAAEIERLTDINRDALNNLNELCDSKNAEIERLKDALDCDRAILKARTESRDALQAKLSAMEKQEPVAWNHDCAGLCANDVELWIDRCPHCGKPRYAHPAPEAKQEPVAWMSPGKERIEFSRADTVYGSHTIPLYTAPKVAQQPLTDEQFNNLVMEHLGPQAQGEAARLWCETCEGGGTVDNTLGGDNINSTSHDKCPDCDGHGYFLSSVYRTRGQQP